MTAIDRATELEATSFAGGYWASTDPDVDHTRYDARRWRIWVYAKPERLNVATLDVDSAGRGAAALPDLDLALLLRGWQRISPWEEGSGNGYVSSVVPNWESLSEWMDNG